MTNEDAQLLQSLKEGDIGALTTLHNKYSRDMYFSSFNVMKNRKDAEDIVQKAFLKICEDWTFIAIDSNLKGYLCTFVRRLSLNEIESRTAHDKTKQKYGACIELSECTDIYEEDERITAIKEALKDFPIKMRKIFYDIAFKEMSHKEVAKELGMSVYTVRIKYYTMRKFLRSKLLKK
jgi:RNA polymerase sigma-70 factor (ECF subfamily)